jgi:hypothetical protein
MRKEKCITQDLFLLTKPEGCRPLGRPRRRWEVNMKADIKEAGCMCAVAI